MTVAYHIAQIAKRENSFISDYELCKKLGISMQKLNNWKNGKSNPSGLSYLKLIKEANLDIDTAIEMIEKQRGFANLSLLFMTALAGIAPLALKYESLIVHYVK